MRRGKSGRMMVLEIQGWRDNIEGSMLLYMLRRLVDTLRDMPSLVIMHACGENLIRFFMVSDLLLS